MIPTMGGMFRQFFGAIRIWDGAFGEYTSARRIVCHQNGGVKEFLTNGNSITGCIYRRGRKIVEHMVIDKFHKGYTQFDEKSIPGPVICHYHPNYRRVLHGITVRKNVPLFGYRGTCKTMYTRGRFVWQEFRYKNRRRAYRLHHRDSRVVIHYPTGRIAGIVETSRGGFSTSVRHDHTAEYSGKRETVSVRNGIVIFPFAVGFHVGDGVNRFDFSRTGNCKIQFWDRKGRTRFKGEYRDRQRVGEWMINGRRHYIINGVEVAKKLWDTAPADLNIRKVLTIQNAQLRMALMSRIGYQRLATELKHKVIHDDKRRRNRLIQLPIRADRGAGNGERDSWMRILIVTCTSTGQKYYLNVPDYIAPHGRRIYLNTCEQARQWTFHNDDPRKNIKFHLET